MPEKVEVELKHILQPDDIYLCRSDLLVLMANVQSMSDSDEAKHNIQVIMDMVSTP